jgi:CheY-like chemotaxis protein
MIYLAAIAALAIAVALPWLLVIAAPFLLLGSILFAIPACVIQMVKNSTKIKCLIIDDDPIYSELMQELLQKKGVLANMAQNAEESIKLFFAHRPSLILLDLNMPGMNGESTLALLDKLMGLFQKPKGQTKVIIISASAHQARIEKKFTNFDVIGVFPKSDLTKLASQVKPMVLNYVA